MSDIGPGDWVECVKSRAAHPVREHFGGHLVVGTIYCVKTVFLGRYADGVQGEGITVRGIVAVNAEGREGGWPLEYFRPIYRPKQSIIEALKQPAPEEPVSA